MAQIGSELRDWPFPRSRPFDPPVEYAALRAIDPVCRVRLSRGNFGWLVTRHSDIQTVLRDRRFSSDVHMPGFPQPNETSRASKGFQHSFVRMDPPDHDQHRRMVASAFRVSQVTKLRGDVEEIADRLLNRMEKSGQMADIVNDFARPLPAFVACRMVGVPYRDVDFIQQCVLSWTDYSSAAGSSVRAAEQLFEYLDSLVSARIKIPRNDLTTKLAYEQLVTRQLSRSALVHMLYLLLASGFHTTANMIALSVLLLTERPADAHRLRNESALMPSAVEELLRYLSIAHYTALRVAREDLELAQVHIKTGEGIIAPIAAGNHDPAVFTYPSRFDVSRTPGPHLAFGSGIHQCLGLALARIELSVALDKLLNRFPSLGLAIPAGSLKFTNNATYGVSSLPVRLFA